MNASEAPYVIQQATEDQRPAITGMYTSAYQISMCAAHHQVLQPYWPDLNWDRFPRPLCGTTPNNRPYATWAACSKTNPQEIRGVIHTRMTSPTVSTFYFLYIDPKYKDQGIGTNLMIHGFNWLIGHGARTMTADIEPAPEKFRWIKFLSRKGAIATATQFRPVTKTLLSKEMPEPVVLPWTNIEFDDLPGLVMRLRGEKPDLTIDEGSLDRYMNSSGSRIEDFRVFATAVFANRRVRK
ncbi:MAG: N-acetyltransferase [Alphaproteobacteria bacterium]|nr:MAG: N-acetyltransferase [Alphaproteobacteria bacterium]